MITRLKDQSGASIVIALLFFMICLAVGGVVVAASSAGASMVPAEKKSQQTEYDVGCAAQALGDQLASSKLSVESVISNNVKHFTVTSIEGTDLARAFWGKQWATVFGNYAQGKSTTISDVNVAAGDNAAVTGTLTFDSNLNMTLVLGLAGDDSYQMTVYLQAVPTYSNTGNLRSVAYEAPSIQKTSDAAARGGA